MWLLTRGLGSFALLTGGLGGGYSPPPPPPAPPPIVQAVGGSGTGGSEYDAYSTDRAFSADDGLDREPSDYFEAVPSTPDDELSWADQLARTLARFWVPRHTGQERGPTVNIGGARDAGKQQEHWAVSDLRTAGAHDAGKIQETWESPDEFKTVGATDAGKIDEDW